MRHLDGVLRDDSYGRAQRAEGETRDIAAVNLYAPAVSAPASVGLMHK
jgi:hypothetical protein